MNIGIVIKTTGSRYYVKTTDSDKIYPCSIKGKFRIQGFRATNPATVGDRVGFETVNDSYFAIVKIFPRKNYIIRKASKLSKENQIIAANVDLAALMITLYQPETSTNFIDRFLVSTRAYQIPTIILINKIDMYGSQAMKEKLKLYNDIYSSAGYQCLQISAKTGRNLEKLKSILHGNISLLAGNSGVGKSTLINKFDPSLNLKVQKISEYHKTGKHTTTFSEMLPLPFGGYIIDTPGIRGFGIIDIKKEELYHFFPEIFLMANNCKYHNCLHYKEPACAVKEATKKGSISQSRYRNYIEILLDENTKYRVD